MAEKKKVGNASISKRPGAKKGDVRNPTGKKPGTKNRRTIWREQMEQQAFEAGITPLQFLQQMLENKGKQYSTHHQMFAADKMLPYVHRKMPVAVEMVGEEVPTPVKVVIEFKDARKKTKAA